MQSQNFNWVWQWVKSVLISLVKIEHKEREWDQSCELTVPSCSSCPLSRPLNYTDLHESGPEIGPTVILLFENMIKSSVFCYKELAKSLIRFPLLGKINNKKKDFFLCRSHQLIYTVCFLKTKAHKGASNADVQLPFLDSCTTLESVFRQHRAGKALFSSSEYVSSHHYTPLPSRMRCSLCSGDGFICLNVWNTLVIAARNS